MNSSGSQCSAPFVQQKAYRIPVVHICIKILSYLRSILCLNMSLSHFFCHNEHTILNQVDSTFPLKCIFNTFSNNKVLLVWFWSLITSSVSSNLFGFRRLWNTQHYKMLIAMNIKFLLHARDTLKPSMFSQNCGDPNQH